MHSQPRSCQAEKRVHTGAGLAFTAATVLGGRIALLSAAPRGCLVELDTSLRGDWSWVLRRKFRSIGVCRRKRTRQRVKSKHLGSAWIARSCVEYSHKVAACNLAALSLPFLSGFDFLNSKRKSWDRKASRRHTLQHV
jgi:hypothetical protein